MAITWAGTAWAALTAYAIGDRVVHATDPAWAGSTSYAQGAQVVNNGLAYVCTAAGTSASSGGPTGIGGSIADGGATWAFVGPEVFSVYRCTVPGTSASSGGPTGTTTAALDGSVLWEYLGTNGGAVVNLAGELAAVVAASQRQILDEVDDEMDPDTWGSQLDTGACYLAAHVATLARSRGKGPILQETVGQLQRSYGDLMKLGELGQTSYGVEYMRLARLTVAVLGEVF